MHWLYILLQCTLILLVVLHDWAPAFPLNDLESQRRWHSFRRRVMETLAFVLPLVAAVSVSIAVGPDPPTWAAAVLVGIYAFYTFLTLYSWWVPYLTGISAHRPEYEAFAHTHRFLPHRGKMAPNTAHTILHALVWACLALSLLLFARAG
jgi:hypothetical protein